MPISTAHADNWIAWLLDLWIQGSIDWDYMRYGMSLV